MDIRSVMFGRQSLIINPALLERQLMQEMKPRRATHITGFALGFDNTIFANPIAANCVVDQYASALAAMAGQMRNVLVLCAERQQAEGEPAEHFAKEVKVAQNALAEFDQVYRLAQTMPPKTDFEIRDQSGRTLVDSDETLPSLAEVLAETGGPATTEELVGVTE